MLYAQQQQGCRGRLSARLPGQQLLLVQLQLNWVSATEGELAWSIFPIWDWSLFSCHNFRQLRNSCRLVTAQMTADTGIAPGFVQGLHIETLLSVVFVTPSTADWLLFRGKPFTLIQCHNSCTRKTAGRSFTLSFHLNSSCFFLNPTLHMPLVLSVPAKYLCSSPCPGFEDRDK